MAATANPRLEAALDLARRMPPAAAPKTVDGLVSLLPRGEAALAEELLERVEQPLEEALDEGVGRSFLLTPYNRDGDSHRSPWSNQYFPPLPPEEEQGEGEGEEPPYYPSDALRTLEAEANELWEVYRELYYGGEAVGSVFLWDLDSGVGGSDAGTVGLAGCFAVKKRIKDGPGGLQDAGWDALHVVEALPAADGRSATYKLTSSALLSLAVRGAAAAVGEMDVSGSVTRQAEASHPLASGAGALPPAQQHLAHMGRLIEDTEIQLRGDLDALYLQRTREIVHAIRKSGGSGGVGQAVSQGVGSESEGDRGGSRPKQQQQHQRPPPAGGIRLPGMGGGPPGHQQSLFEAINRRRAQREEEDVVEG